jgi:hypothetical protein
MGPCREAGICSANKKGKRIPFIFNDESTGSCIFLRLNLYLSHVKIGARHLGSLCSILPFSHKKYPRQETVMYVARCIQGMFLVVPTFVSRCHYLRKDARDPDGNIWNCEREGWPIKDVTRLLYVIPSCKTSMSKTARFFWNQEAPIPCTQQPTTTIYPESEECSPHPSICYCNVNSNVILSSTRRMPK